MAVDGGRRGVWHIAGIEGRKHLLAYVGANSDETDGRRVSVLELVLVYGTFIEGGRWHQALKHISIKYLSSSKTYRGIASKSNGASGRHHKTPSRRRAAARFSINEQHIKKHMKEPVKRCRRGVKV
jgi:hypothetical protein